MRKLWSKLAMPIEEVGLRPLATAGLGAGLVVLGFFILSVKNQLRWTLAGIAFITVGLLGGLYLLYKSMNKDEWI